VFEEGWCYSRELKDESQFLERCNYGLYELRLSTSRATLHYIDARTPTNGTDEGLKQGENVAILSLEPAMILVENPPKDGRVLWIKVELLRAIVESVLDPN